jgi:hypothetical protein
MSNLQIFKNVLRPETLAAVLEERTNFLGQPVWRCSDHFWGEEIKVGVTGVVTSTMCSHRIGEMVRNDILHIMPPCTTMAVQHYMWHKHSAISSHNDWAYAWAATIYLNENWNLDWGGLFMWQDSDNGEIHGHVPEYNSMALNKGKVNHFVTPLSPLAPENRISLQIWGKV